MRTKPILSKLSERHLYSDIVILHDQLRWQDRDRLCLRVSQLTQLLSNGAHISNYVRNLKIYGGINLEDISSMLPMFSQLRKYTLSGFYPIWQVPEKFRSAFFDTLNLRPLKDVSIERIPDFPLSLLDNCKTLRSLTLDRCSLVHPNSNKAGTAFESLCIRNCDETSLRNIITWVRTRRVRSLEFLLVTRPDKLFLRLLSQCASSLTYLNLDIGNQLLSQFNFRPNDSFREFLPNIMTVPFTLSTVPHLKKLTIRSIAVIRRPFVGHPCWIHDSNVPAITQFITTAPSSLKELIFDINFAQRLGHSESPPNADVIWYPLISLATKCSSLCIKVYLSAWLTRAGTKSLHAVSYSKEMLRFIEQGALVPMPQDLR